MALPQLSFGHTDLGLHVGRSYRNHPGHHIASAESFPKALERFVEARQRGLTAMWLQSSEFTISDFRHFGEICT